MALQTLTASRISVDVDQLYIIVVILRKDEGISSVNWHLKKHTEN